MTVIRDTGFEGDTLAESFNNSLPATTTISKARMRGGSQSYRLLISGTSGFGGVTVSAGNRVVCARFAYLVHAAPAANIYITSATSTSNMRIFITSGRALGITIGGSTRNDTGNVLTVDTWYFFAVRFDTSTATGKIDYSYYQSNGTLIATATQFTGAITSADITDVRFGTTITGTAEVYYDDAKVTNVGADHPLGLPSLGNVMLARAV